MHNHLCYPEPTGDAGTSSGARQRALRAVAGGTAAPGRVRRPAGGVGGVGAAADADAAAAAAAADPLVVGRPCAAAAAALEPPHALALAGNWRVDKRTTSYRNDSKRLQHHLAS